MRVKLESAGASGLVGLPSTWNRLPTLMVAGHLRQRRKAADSLVTQVPPNRAGWPYAHALGDLHAVNIANVQDAGQKSPPLQGGKRNAQEDF
jgi:hypothetical protein